MFKITDTQQVGLRIKGQSASGNVAELENVQVTSSDTSIATVSGDNETGFVIAAVGPAGTTQIAVTADARIGDGEVPLQGMETIEVVAGEAVVIALQFDEPSEQA